MSSLLRFFSVSLILMCVEGIHVFRPDPCHEKLTVNITDGSRQSDDSISKDNVTYTRGDYFWHENSILGCICNIKKCLPKCCGPDEVLFNETCIDNDSVKFDPIIHNNTVPFVTHEFNFHILHNNGCIGNKGLLFEHLVTSDSKMYVQHDGILYIPTWLEKGYLKQHQYCSDNYLSKKSNKWFKSGYVCIHGDMEKNAKEPLLYTIGMIISMPFLLLTFIAYALLPDRNLHMKALMSYVMTLLLGYILLVVVQLNSVQLDIGPCKTLGYSIIFTLMASFLWMNVICIDIWFAFSGLRGFSGTKRAENKRFIFYNIYAWGVTILITIIVILMNEINQPSKAWYVPGISSGQCFLSNGYPELVYFYGPMGVIITINIILFAMTAFRIRQVKKETSMLKKSDSQRHSSYEDDKQKFNLYLKLLFAMGVNWSMEIISWAVSWKVQDAPKSIWHLTDFCNAIYGVFIFFIFVFKRSIYKLLMKRYYSFRGQSHLAHSMTANPTRATSYSTASTTIRDSNQGGNAHDSSLLTTTET